MAYFKSKQKDNYIYPPIPNEPEVFPQDLPQIDPSTTPSDSTTELLNDTNIVFYIVNDDSNTVHKNKTNQYVMAGTIQQDVDILNPVLIIDSDTDLTNFNYVYLSCFNRYYFAKISLLYGGRYEVVCNVDALSTWFNSISRVPCIIDKEEQHNDLYLNDGTFVQGNKNYSTVLNYSNGFNDAPQNILICCGGL